ncbi:hypothetical protein BJ170DRAFT_167178 [Xylariales sp. AK1849]|nr:hypothetical protein BJ170DRAFT_167178 [Xylariales sp. AK1849]
MKRRLILHIYLLGITCHLLLFRNIFTSASERMERTSVPFRSSDRRLELRVIPRALFSKKESWKEGKWNRAHNPLATSDVIIGGCGLAQLGE